VEVPSSCHGSSSFYFYFIPFCDTFCHKVGPKIFASRGRIVIKDIGMQTSGGYLPDKEVNDSFDVGVY